MSGDFQAVSVVGGIVPPGLLGRIQSGDVRDPSSLSAASYGLAGGEGVRDAAARAWSYLRGAWDAWRAADADLPAGNVGTGPARDKWLLVLLRELGYGQVPAHRGALRIDEHDYPISHHWNHVQIHLLGPRIELDRRNPGVSGAARAPQAMVQEFLNRSDPDLWAILSNGLRLRLLRDSTSLAGSAYLEFDLEAIFDGELYPEFLMFWQLTQFSRLDKRGGPEAPPSDCWIEAWRGEAVDAGTRALDKLRDGVETALQALGSGFLRHPENRWLVDALHRGELSDRDLHRALLRLAYRLLFVFVAEDRNALLDPEAPALVQDRYRQYFSTARLRRLSRRHRGGPHPDLWRSQRLILRALGGQGRPELGVPALGGLFDPDRGAPVTGQPTADLLLGAELANADLLAAIRALAWVTVKGSRVQPVDYRHLGAEELGSVYESLLELVPRVDLAERRFRLEQVSGNERKTTGSYYTPPALVSALLDTALDPLLDDAVKNADSDEHAEQRLLAMTVCDPACGSGGFLVAAARRIARRVAQLRSGEDEPTPVHVQHALRDVVGRCIYGVDLNDLAAELAKVSLWLEALEPGKPLGFLDARIRIGNSLLGTTPALLAGGVPDAAFKEIEGDDKKYAASIRKRNKLEAGNLAFHLETDSTETTTLRKQRREVLTPTTDDVDAIRAQADAWRAYEHSDAVEHQRLHADAWSAAFVWPLRADAPTPPTNAILDQIAATPDSPHLADTIDQVQQLADDFRFFHWHLEFPEVFDDAGGLDTRTEVWTGGFGCLLGNPPWDTLSPDHKEFFAMYDPEIRHADKARQVEIITELTLNPQIEHRWIEYRRRLFSTVHFVRHSTRYRLFAPGNLGKGDFNTYRMFVETSLDMTAKSGSVAQVLPGGFYSGANAMALRSELYHFWELIRLWGFINTKEAWFEGVDATTRFCAYVATKGGRTDTIGLSFGIANPVDLVTHPEPATYISIVEIESQSPAALAIPEVVDSTDADLASAMSRLWGSFGDVDQSRPQHHYQREIDMGTDRDLLQDRDDGLPVYEGRMIDLFDYRAKAWISGRGRSAVWKELPFGSIAKTIRPQWRVMEQDVPKKIGDRTQHYRVGFGDVTSPRNERSLIAALIPPSTICGHKVPTIYYPPESQWLYMFWLAVANAIATDFLARKKVALSMSYTVVNSLPFPRVDRDDLVHRKIISDALALTCTGPEMDRYFDYMSDLGFADELDQDLLDLHSKSEEARATTRARIDAMVAHYIYGLQERDVEHILGQFPVLRRREEREFGEFRTQRLMIEAMGHHG